MFRVAICAALALAGCAVLPPLERPSKWTPEQRQAMQDAAELGPGGLCQAAAQVQGKHQVQLALGDSFTYFTKDDRAILAPEFKRRGFSPRDIEILLDPDHLYATGMSFRGLSCALGYEPPVNDAFYPGAGHQWQAVLPGYRYVYLEGDGTKSGMRVKAWN